MKIYCSIAALLIALSASPASAAPEKAKVSFIVYDIGADRVVARTAVEFDVYADCASGPEILRSAAVTGERGDFEASLPIGQHLVVLNSLSGSPVRSCVDIASLKDIESCGSRSLQSLLVRTVSGNRQLPGDILNRHPCAPYLPSVCDELSLSRKVNARRVVFVDEQKHPIANLALEFRQYSKAIGESFGSVTTDSEGVADLSGVYARASGHLVQVSTNKSGTFLLQFSPTPTSQLQRIRFVEWRCEGHEQLQATSD